MPASRSACATTLAPRSCPSSPGLAIRTFIRLRLRPARASARERPERDEPGAHARVLDRELGHGDRQLEAAWAGAARVQVEDAVALVDARLVAVAADDRREAGRARLEVELVQVAQQGER